MQALDRGNDSLRVTGERFLISRQGAQCLRWRKNGRELYYLGFDGRVYAVPLAFGAGRVRAGQPEPLFTIDAEARAAIHSVCLVRRFRRWQPLRDSVDDAGRELGAGGAARLGVAGDKVNSPKICLCRDIRAVLPGWTVGQAPPIQAASRNLAGCW